MRSLKSQAAPIVFLSAPGALANCLIVMSAIDHPEQTSVTDHSSEVELSPSRCITAFGCSLH